MKGERLKTAVKYVIAIAAALIIGGCEPQSTEKKIPADTEKPRELLTVNFKQSKVLRYKFVSSRQIEILLEDNTGKAGGEKSRYTESLEIIVAYKPVKVEPNGLSIIEATCESIKAQTMVGSSHKEAAENFAGKSFRFTVGPTGKIEDRTELQKLLKEVAETAFRPDNQHGRIKEPDLISDIIATQWFLWDSISSISEPQKGVAVGDSWQSQLSTPSPMPGLLSAGRDVVYTLEDVNDAGSEKIAVISSKFSLSKSPLKDRFVPYTGSFMMSGPFGLYGNCSIVELGGKGRELFNIDAGRTDSYSQDYEMKVVATMAIIPITVKINVKQHLSMQIIEEPKNQNKP